ncbi:MAG: glycoside hydrolase family protein [Campylobacterota bacterium]
MNVYRLKNSIRNHEGLELKPYRCTANKLTIGYGRNLEDRGITEEEAEYLLVRDLQRIQEKLRAKIINYDDLPSNVQEVLVEMAYQIGTFGLFKFKKTLDYVYKKDFQNASIEMLDSLWAKQTPNRAKTLSNKMKG